MDNQLSVKSPNTKKSVIVETATPNDAHVRRPGPQKDSYQLTVGKKAAPFVVGLAGGALALSALPKVKANQVMHHDLINAALNAHAGICPWQCRVTPNQVTAIAASAALFGVVAGPLSPFMGVVFGVAAQTIVRTSFSELIALCKAKGCATNDGSAYLS